MARLEVIELSRLDRQILVGAHVAPLHVRATGRDAQAEFDTFFG